MYNRKLSTAQGSRFVAHSCISDSKYNVIVRKLVLSKNELRIIKLHYFFNSFDP